MPEQHLINKIRELSKELRELDTKITALERKINPRDQNKNDSLEQLEDLKRKKDELQKERSYLQKQVQLQGNLETKEKRIKTFEKQIKTYKNEIKELEQNNQQIEELNNDIVHLQRKIIELKSEIQQLKKKIEERDNRMLLLEKEMKENELNHKNRMKDITAEHEEEIKDLRYKTMAKIEQKQKTHSREMNEIHKSNDFLEHEVQELKAKHSKMENELCNYKKYVSYCSEENKHILYIGQICSDLQTNWYRHVMPKHCHVKGRAYKVKNIIEDICDSEILSEEEQKEAQRKWNELQSEEEWKKNKRLIKAIKRLQYERNQAAHPKDLSKEGAKSAAEELKKQGILKVKPSFQDAQILISLWESSKSL